MSNALCNSEPCFGELSEVVVDQAGDAGVGAKSIVINEGANVKDGFKMAIMVL